MLKYLIYITSKSKIFTVLLTIVVRFTLVLPDIYNILVFYFIKQKYKKKLSPNIDCTNGYCILNKTWNKCLFWVLENIMINILIDMVIILLTFRVDFNSYKVSNPKIMRPWKIFQLIKNVFYFVITFSGRS